MRKIAISTDIKSRMKNGMLWTFTGTALAKFLTLIAGIICAHILTKEQYGEFNMVRSTINMFVVFGSSGLGVTATKYISGYKSDYASKIPHLCYITKLFAYFTGGISTFLILISAPYIATFILRNYSLTFALQLGAILLFFSVINGVQTGILSGFEDFKDIAVNSFIGSIFESVFLLIGSYYGGTEGAILGFGIGFIVIYATNRHSIKKQFSILNIRDNGKVFAITSDDWRIIFGYSLPAALSSILIAPTFWVIRTLLVRKEGFGTLAIFEAADQWKVIILFIPTAISQIVLPLLSSLKQNNNDKYLSTLALNLIIIGAVSTLMAGFVTIACPFIMNMYGKAFNEYSTLRILAFSTIFSAIANVLEMTAYSMGKMWQCFLINIIWALCMILFSYKLLSLGLGASALAYAVLFAYIISCAMFACYIIYLLKSTPQISDEQRG
jgi:O-antigen/teichoic acid export membrane protein